MEFKYNKNKYIHNPSYVKEEFRFTRKNFESNIHNKQIYKTAIDVINNNTNYHITYSSDILYGKTPITGINRSLCNSLVYIFLENRKTKKQHPGILRVEPTNESVELFYEGLSDTFLLSNPELCGFFEIVKLKDLKYDSIFKKYTLKRIRLFDNITKIMKIQEAHMPEPKEVQLRIIHNDKVYQTYYHYSHFYNDVMYNTFDSCLAFGHKFKFQITGMREFIL